MKVTLESTEKIIDLVVDGKAVPARIWQGETSNGVKCHAFITRIAVHNDDDADEFDRDLQDHATMRPEVKAYDIRYFMD